MQEQEYKLTVPSEEIYDQIYQDYGPCLKQAKIMISDYFDTPDLKLLNEGIVVRQRTEDGRNVVQTKKKLEVTGENLFISESKEEIQSEITASKMYHYILQEYNLGELQKVLTLRTLRQMYFCEDFDFTLDKSQYKDYLHKSEGVMYELEMEILSLNKGDISFIQKMEKKYGLDKSRYNKMEKILFQHISTLKKH